MIAMYTKKSCIALLNINNCNVLTWIQLDIIKKCLLIYTAEETIFNQYKKSKKKKK